MIKSELAKKLQGKQNATKLNLNGTTFLKNINRLFLLMKRFLTAEAFQKSK